MCVGFKLHLFVCLAVLLTYSQTGFAQIGKGSKLRLPDGFVGELIYEVPSNQGSWVCLTNDPQGRLIASDQYVVSTVSPPVMMRPKWKALTLKSVGPKACSVRSTPFMSSAPEANQKRDSSVSLTKMTTISMTMSSAFAFSTENLSTALTQ